MSIIENLELTAKNDYCKTLKELTPAELHLCLGKAMMGEIADTWESVRRRKLLREEHTTSQLNS